MYVIFKSAYRGKGGPIDGIPETIIEYISRITRLDGPLKAVVGHLALIAPQDYWVSLDMEARCIRLLHRPEASGDRESVWRLIEFEEV